MKKIQQLILSVFVLLAVFSSSTYGTSEEKKGASLIDSIIAQQKKITSLHCKYTHKRSINNSTPSEYQGLVDYKAPEHLLMHFLYPADEFVLVDDSTVMIYGIKAAYGIRYKKKCLSSAEKQIAEQIGQVKMNLLQTMRDLYVFTIIDSSKPEATTISARPNGGWKNLGKIVITVNAAKKYLRSIAIYAKDGTLFSSTDYSEFVLIKGLDVYFPTTLTVSLGGGQMVQKDLITFSRLESNKPFPPNHFSIPVAKNATIDDQTQNCK